MNEMLRILQDRYRLKYKMYGIIADECVSLAGHVLDMTCQLQRIYLNKLRGQIFYNEMMVQLEKVSMACTALRIQYVDSKKIVSLTVHTYIIVKKSITKCRTQLCNIYSCQGAVRLSDMITLKSDDTSYSRRPCPHQWWLSFINKSFLPFMIDIYTCEVGKIISHTRKHDKKPLFGCLFDKTDKINTKDDIACITQLLTSNNWDLFRTESYCESLALQPSQYVKPTLTPKGVDKVITTLSKQQLTEKTKPLRNNNGSLLEYTNGARVFVVGPNNHIYVCRGLFKDDFFQLMLCHAPLRDKFQAISKIVSTNSTVSAHFSERWLQQLSLRDMVALSAEQIGMKCVNDYTELQSLKSKTIASMVKLFLSSSIDDRLHILTLFLLTERDSDTQYLAYLMYDMISQESYLIRPQPLAEDIYNNLHWVIKKRFRIVIENIGQITGKMESAFQESDINYESRILLMKCPQNVKTKALAKHKEIQSKNGENASKAQQYLDALLRIPFGIYKKEYIFSYFSEFTKKLLSYCEQISCGYADAKTACNMIFKTQCAAITSAPFITTEQVHSFFSILSTYQQTSAVSPVTTVLPPNTSYTSLLLIIKHCKCALKQARLFYHHNGEKKGVFVKKKKNGKMTTVSADTLRLALNHYIVQLSSENRKLILPILTQVLQTADLPESEASPMYTSLATEWTHFQHSVSDYLQQVDTILEESVYGHAKAKRSIKQVVAQWITGELQGYCFGFEGPPGTGKTSLAKHGLAKCLLDINGDKRPFVFIALGGSSNGSTLEGHSYTYVGSTWGRIVDILIETQCMNPIIYIDELDKISRTENGREIIGILTHITDSTQNDEFMDKYFAGVKIDLSRILFVFSYNDRELLDSILRDRIHVIKFDPLKQNEKLSVSHLHLIPGILRALGVSMTDIVFDEDVLNFIIDNYTYEGGVRRLKEKLFDICRELNIRHLLDRETYAFPYHVTTEFLENDIFIEQPLILTKCILGTPRVGLTNGMYASAMGVGGITIIECFIVPKSTFMTLELTGQQGDVMKESMAVARTVAWNLLNASDKKTIYNASKKGSGTGLHIHCPEGGTPKDGPSAGAAITTSIVSCLLKIPVCNTVAMTGEIDLNGQICQIGGLETKIRGAKKAGVTKIIVPRANTHDIHSMCTNDESPFADGTVSYVIVDTIWDVLAHVFPDSTYDFTRF